MNGLMSRVAHYIRRFMIFAIAFVLNLLLWAWLYFFIRPAGDNQVLHYNVYFGIDQLGPGIKLYLLPIFGLIVIGVNLLLSVSKLAYKRLVIYASWSALVVQVFLILSLILLIINHY